MGSITLVLFEPSKRPRTRDTAAILAQHALPRLWQGISEIELAGLEPAASWCDKAKPWFADAHAACSSGFTCAQFNEFLSVW
jgi:hypothetical protein